MITIGKIGWLVPGSLLAAAAAGNAAGQDGFSRWFQPLRGGRTISVAAAGEYYPREEVREQENGFEDARGEVSISLPLDSGPDREWAATIRAGLRSIRTGAALPQTGESFPGELWDLNFGAVHRRRLENGWIAGGQLSLASPSDRPFAGWDETAVLFNGFLRVPSGERNAWIFFLNYSSNREFLPHVPIPGAAFLYAPSRDFSLLAGAPLLSVNWKPTGRLSLRGFYFPIHTVSFGSEYSLGSGWKVFADWRWENDRYYRAGREEKDHRLFWYEQRLEAGIAVEVSPGIELSLAGGYAYDRFFFEGKSYSEDRTENRLDIADGFFLAARVQSRL